MESNIARKLSIEQIERDDVTTYLGDLLIRQRKVNEAVLGFAEDLLPADAIVIDACAGPEGSLTAASIRGQSWFGNDISLRFAQNLRDTGAKRIVVSDFSRSPFAENTADAIYLVFAMNNIKEPALIFSEAKRVLKPHGILVVADAGPTMWISRILAHYFLANCPDQKGLLKSKVMSEGIPNFFKNRSYSEADYCNYFIHNSLGIRTDVLAELAHELAADCVQGSMSTTKERRRFDYRFHEAVLYWFYTHGLNTALDQGFKPIRIGVSATYRSKGPDWEIMSPQTMPADDWIDHMLAIKNCSTHLYGGGRTQFEKSRFRIVFPIICFAG